MPDDDVDDDDARLLCDLLVAVAARPQDRNGAGRARTLVRRAIELIWEKPRENGGSYGQYRYNFFWSPAAIERANSNMSRADYGGDRGLVKEHVVPYQALIARLVGDAEALRPETLAEILRASITVAVITADEDKALRGWQPQGRPLWPADLDLTDRSEVWFRYPRDVGDLAVPRTLENPGPPTSRSLRRVRVAPGQEGKGRLLQAIDGERPPGSV